MLFQQYGQKKGEVSCGQLVCLTLTIRCCSSFGAAVRLTKHYQEEYRFIEMQGGDDVILSLDVLGLNSMNLHQLQGCCSVGEPDL